MDLYEFSGKGQRTRQWTKVESVVDNDEEKLVLEHTLLQETVALSGFYVRCQ